MEFCVEGYEEDFIFEKKDSGLFGLRDNVEFYLYINIFFCGDVRIFFLYEVVRGEVDKYFGRRKRGFFRVKLENGEG